MNKVRFSDIELLISKNCLNEAVEELLGIMKDTYSQKVLTAYKQEIYDNKEKYNSELVTFQDSVVRNNTVINDLLGFLEKNRKSISVVNGVEIDFYEYGNQQLHQKELNLAVDYFSKSIKNNPKHYNSYIDRGTANLLLGEHIAAIEDFTTALELAPNHHFALLNRGVAHYCSGNLQQAQNDWKSVKSLGYTIADNYLDE